jgi:chemotaxis protein methyltransferase WspC
MALNPSEPSLYADLLQRSKPELQSLIEAVVIPETFFFRYPESFTALRQIVGEQFLFGTNKVRALSVPCSTGEKPYSIAMTLLDAGLPLERFQVDAIDISAHVRNIARLGMFGANSFRGSALEFRNQYFRKTDTGFQVCDRVRRCVKFEGGNILEERFRDGSEPYDFIFCRNLLIYFYTEAQDQALKNLRQHLTPGGILFVGSAETGPLTQLGLSSVKLPMAFAFRKRESIALHPLPNRKQPKVRSPAKAGRTEVYCKPELAILKNAIPETAKHQNSMVRDLAFAELLADKGQLVEAAQICEFSLREQGPSARAFHLLGLIRDCAGDQHQASEFYRKALYILSLIIMMC